MFAHSTGYFFEILIVLLGQLLLIGALLVQRRRRGRAEEALRISNETLERRVADRTAQLQANEARYHSLFNSMTEGFALHEIICDVDGKPADYRFLEINPAFERLTGLSRETVTGKTVRQIMPDVETYWIETYGRVALGGKPVHIENYSAPLNRWFEVYAYQTAPGTFAAAFTDITERKRAEEALRESEKRLNRAQEIAHLGSWELDLTRNELIWSDEVYRIFGLAPQEFTATYEAFLEHVHPDDRTAVNDAYSGSIREGRDTYEIDHRVVRSSNGEIRFVHEKCQHVRDKDGQIIRSLGMVLDITDRKHAEKALRRLAHFPEENPNPVLRCTVAGDIMYANRPADQWLATFDRQADDFSPLPDPVRQAVAEACRHDHAIDAEIINSAGRTFGISAIQPPGEVYVNLYAIDLTDRKRAQEALERSNRELEQFAYVASHDLQEPLRAIVGFLQLLQSRYEDKVDEKGKHYIERTVKAAHRMQTLIRELLTLSRVNSKGSTFLPTDLSLLVQGVLDTLQTTILERKAEVTCAILPTIRVDAGQIRSLFQNLLLNALHYNESPKPLVTIGVQELDDTYRFQVQDNGIGISPQFHQRIFMVFQRLHTEREYPGTGLGLALCKKIIERHGGTIWVESTPPGGSTFYFTLPKEV
jgi:PAS domain S-box-containing protein